MTRRERAKRVYCTGLLMPGERKSVEPIANFSRTEFRARQAIAMTAGGDLDSDARYKAGDTAARAVGDGRIRSASRFPRHAHGRVFVTFGAFVTKMVFVT